MDYEVNKFVDVSGSCLQGKIKTTYDKLVELFGAPTYKDADPYAKVNAEWTVMATVKKTGDDHALIKDFEMDEDYTDEVKFSIYNWKDGYIPTEEYEWHIGGYGFEAVDTAYEIINA